MVNKGFKNMGVIKTSEKLSPLNYKIPVGISIGVSNNKLITDLKDGINDIRKSFLTFEKFKIKNSYYEINISCPNLINSSIDFYKPENFNRLLQSIKRLKLRKPIFVKMPIDRNNQNFWKY